MENAKTQLWEGEEHVVDDALRFVASPGHSPGACVLTISSGGEKALLAGDLVHHPMQILDPAQRNTLDADGAMATRSRTRLLGWAVENSSTRPARVMGRRRGTNWKIRHVRRLARRSAGRAAG
ncbi:MBL fold metallo-hydrolase [Streptomyces coeruleorubidus]|uniref:hypothetical protein n=1 Tax=Streptomyces coeruleorubidus TaxID=116188 RepID=UPI00365D2DC6